MDRSTTILTIAGGVVALALAAGAGVVVVTILRGTKLLPDGTVSLDGVNPADPGELAAAAGLTLDEYALARMVNGEAGGVPVAGQVGVAWACRTFAERKRKPQSVAALLLHSAGAGNGYFGSQNQGRYATTAKDPTPASIRVATSVLAGDELDPTGGADQWDSPWSYTANVKTGESAADKAARVAQDREDAGKVLVLVDGVPERHLRFWRSA